MQKYQWGITSLICNKIEKHLGFDNYGYYNQGKYFISEDSRIQNRVSPSLKGELIENLLVDFSKDKELESLYFKILTEIKENDFKKSMAIPIVYALAKSAMSPNNEKVEELLGSKKLSIDELIPLGEFLKKEAGVCRHYALLCAAILERLIDEGHIEGKASVDRNYINNEGHAWCRYVNPKGEIIIIDPARDYLGNLEDSLLSGWNYYRPEDNQINKQ